MKNSPKLRTKIGCLTCRVIFPSTEPAELIVESKVGFAARNAMSNILYVGDALRLAGNAFGPREKH